MFDKPKKSAQIKSDPDPETEATVVAEEAHPATKAVMAARAAAFPAPELKDAIEVKKTLKPGGILAGELEDIMRRLLDRGGHAPLCPTRSHHKDACVCGWGPAEAEAKAALGLE